MSGSTSYFPPDYFAPAYFTAGYFGDGTGGGTTPSGSSALRDWDVFEAIEALLRATRAFDGVYFSDSPDLKGRAADRHAIAIVCPGSGDESEGWDDPTGLAWRRDVSWTLRVTVRDPDPRSRDRKAERLCNAARVAIDYQGFGGLCDPSLTKFGRDRYLPASPPSRTVELAGKFTYLIDGQSHATDR